LIFIDTTVWVSAIDSADKLHDDGKSVVQSLARRDLPHAVTTDFVLDETLTLLKRRGARPRKVVELVKDIMESEFVTTVFVEQEAFAEALSSFAKYEQLSFTDAVTLEVMKRYRIKEIFSHDSDFDLNGIVRKERP
jgi:predicted nucleic acid-binding protein